VGRLLITVTAASQSCIVASATVSARQSSVIVYIAASSGFFV
jgi:hypothetical protein